MYTLSTVGVLLLADISNVLYQAFLLLPLMCERGRRGRCQVSLVYKITGEVHGLYDEVTSWDSWGIDGQRRGT
jgi:hypothetical protein